MGVIEKIVKQTLNLISQLKTNCRNRTLLGLFSATSMFILTGCSINEIGAVKAQLYENSTAYVLASEAYGGILNTHSWNRRGVLGYSKQYYVFPKSNTVKQDIEVDLSELLASKKESLKKLNHPPEADLLGEPIAFVSQIDGVSFDINQLRFGIFLGHAAFEAIRLPLDFNGHIFFQYDSEQEKAVKVLIENRGER